MRVVPDRATRRRVAYNVGGVDRVNRAVLGVVGLAAAAAGVLVLLLAVGVITWGDTPASLYTDAASDATGSPVASAAIASGGCLVLALVAVVWALAQLRPVGGPPKLGTVQLGSSERGRTTVVAVAVARAAAADIAGLFGVLDAHVRLLATRPRPRVEVTVELGLDTDIAGVMSELDEALGRLGRALEAPTVDTEIRIRFGNELRKTRGVHRLH